MDSDDEQDDWQYVDCFPEAAAALADDAHRFSIGGTGDAGLRLALSCTRAMSFLYGVGAAIDNATTKTRSRLATQVKNLVIADSAKQEPALGDVMDFARRYTQTYASSVDATETATEQFLARCDATTHILPRSLIERQEIVPDEDDAMEQYSHAVTKSLFDTFYRKKYLYCNCKGQKKAVHLVDEYCCALRLDGELKTASGDESHCFFDSVIKKHDQNHRWTIVQFQLPRVFSKVAFQIPVDSAIGTTSSVSSDSEDLAQLDDFCQIFETDIQHLGIPIRLEGNEANHVLYTASSLDQRIQGECFLREEAPIQLSFALRNANEEGEPLSARSKVYLAYTLSKSVWQYYESDWMRAKWDLESICLLPQYESDQTFDLESKTAYLSVGNFNYDEVPLTESEPSKLSNGLHNTHRYPYLLRLGLLLVLLGSRNPDGPVVNSTGFKRKNDIIGFCIQETRSSSKTWPDIDIPREQKEIYRRIVLRCLCLSSPQSTPNPFTEKTLDIAGRRAVLKNEVVRPLYKILRDMRDPEPPRMQEPRKSGMHNKPRTAEYMDHITGTPSEESAAWIGRIQGSDLVRNISGTLYKQAGRLKRPKIAIIDTGFDPKSGFINHKVKMRLNMIGHESNTECNWKDFWRSSDEPIDEHGHGTSMLSLITNVAPFADLCVARIASSDEDLNEHAAETSSNLAQAILWAVNVQNADIISMSLGWNEEKRFAGRMVVSNTILDVLSKQNQKVLFFAAASNYGSSGYDFFPANHPLVFAIRGTDVDGVHQGFNAALPKTGEDVFGTLGKAVPAATRGETGEGVGRDGTSPATAIAAGLAAAVLGYINVNGGNGTCDNLRTPQGFARLLHIISKESDSRKRFFTLENYYKEENRDALENILNIASRAAGP